MGEQSDFDPEQIAVLYDRYAPALYGAALRFTGGPLAAERLLLLTFERLWHDRSFIGRSTGSELPYMLSIMRTLATSLGHSTSDMQPQLGSVGTLAALPNELRAVYTACLVEGSTPHAVAMGMGEPVALVRQRLCLALRSMVHNLRLSGRTS